MSQPFDADDDRRQEQAELSEVVATGHAKRGQHETASAPLSTSLFARQRAHEAEAAYRRAEQAAERSTAEQRAALRKEAGNTNTQARRHHKRKNPPAVEFTADDAVIAVHLARRGALAQCSPGDVAAAIAVVRRLEAWLREQGVLE